MRRLYKQVYLAVVGSLLMVVVFGGILWQFAPGHRPSDEAFEMAGELISTLLPPANEGLAAQQQAIDRLYARLKIDLGLFSSDLHLLAAAGGPVPRPRDETGGWMYGKGGPAWAIRLPDDRWIVARLPRRRGPPILGILWTIAPRQSDFPIPYRYSFYSFATALQAHPVVRAYHKGKHMGAGPVSPRSAADITSIYHSVIQGLSGDKVWKLCPAAIGNTPCISS